MKIENQAVLFALLAKAAIETKGEHGRAVIQEGMLRYGRERGRRMAARARANGDPIELWTEQAYGEWKPDYEGQMEFGYLQTEPTLVSYISKCAWCEAWKKYGLLEYGREYCRNVDNAVYQGFDPEYECTTVGETMSFGGDRCVFDWGRPLSEEDLAKMKAKKAELGDSAVMDFDYHTAHVYFAVTALLRERFQTEADPIIDKAVRDYVALFGREDYINIIEHSPNDF